MAKIIHLALTSLVLVYFCNMDTHELSLFIKEKALELGFESCGFAKASPISCGHRETMETWIQKGFHGQMNYMERNRDKRYDPCLLVDNAASVISVAINHCHSSAARDSFPKIAQYAYGKDYHQIIRNKLRRLLNEINNNGFAVTGRAFSDSAPVAERYWAAKAGLGWIGKNHQLIIPGKGSRFFLGELIIDRILDYDEPQDNRCGKCNRCIAACPGKAIKPNDGLDANNCIAYLTIEKQGTFNEKESILCGESGYIFGCDICQDVCPWNRFSKEQNAEEMKPADEIIAIDWGKVLSMSRERFKNNFSDTPLMRTGLGNLSRNFQAIKKQFKTD